MRLVFDLLVVVVLEDELVELVVVFLLFLVIDGCVCLWSC